MACADETLVDAATELLAVTEGLCKTHCPSCGHSHAVNQPSPGCLLQKAQQKVVESLTGRQVDDSQQELF